MENSIIFAIEIIGTIAFASSGVLIFHILLKVFILKGILYISP